MNRLMNKLMNKLRSENERDAKRAFEVDSLILNTLKIRRLLLLKTAGYFNEFFTNKYYKDVLYEKATQPDYIRFLGPIKPEHAHCLHLIDKKYNKILKINRNALAEISFDRLADAYEITKWNNWRGVLEKAKSLSYKNWKDYIKNKKVVKK